MNNTSDVEFNTSGNSRSDFGCEQELIIDNDFVLTNEKVDLLQENETNDVNHNSIDQSNKSVLITEVEFEDNYRIPVLPFSNEMLGALIETDEVSQMSETNPQSTFRSQRLKDEIEDNPNDHLSIEDNESGEEKESLFSKEDIWDTDLEEDFNTSKDRSTASIYIDLCTKYEVVPVKYYLNNMHKSILSIKHHGLGSLGARALAKSLESNISVESLDLSGNWIYPSGAMAVGKMLEENNFITKLVLCDNLIGDQGIIAICNAIQINRGLRHLDLSGNQITDNGCTDLSELINKSKYLTELSLSRNNIDSKGGHILAGAIASNDILEYLDLSWNKIRGEGAVDIAKGLKENIRIKKCDLSYNGFGKDGGRALVDTIRDNTALISLNLEANRIDGETAGSIGRALLSNDTLEELRLCHNTMNTSGILSLLSSINSYDASPLKALHLTDVPIDFEITKVIENIQVKRPEFRCIHGLEMAVGNSEEDIKKRLTNLKHPIILLKEHVFIKDKRLIDILIKLDISQNKFVTIDQFAQALQELGVPFKTSQISEIQTHLDKMGNGTIYYGDFIPKTDNHPNQSINEVTAEV